MSKQQFVEKIFKETLRLFQVWIENIRRCVQLAIAERFIEDIDDHSIRFIDWTFGEWLWIAIMVVFEQ
jgi:phosphate uptake regulator